MIHYITLSIFFIIILSIVLLNRMIGFDMSIGETKPKITDKATYLKFYVHWVTACTITWFMWMTGLSLIEIAALMIIAIPLYEWSQKFINKLDMLAGAVGIITTFIVIYAFA
jgi:hypothetical protein